MLFRCFGGHFRKMAQNGRFLAFGAVFTTFGGQKLLLRPKSGKAQKRAKVDKSSFSLQAQNTENIRFWARFRGPKRRKAFFHFWANFSVLERFWRQKRPTSGKWVHFQFCGSKSGKIAFLEFWSQKGARNVTFIKGFALLAKVSENHFFHVLIWFHVVIWFYMLLYDFTRFSLDFYMVFI